MIRPSWEYVLISSLLSERAWFEMWMELGWIRCCCALGAAALWRNTSYHPARSRVLLAFMRNWTRVEPRLTMIAVNPSSSATAATDTPSAASPVPRPAWSAAAALPSLRLPSWPASASVPATGSFPRPWRTSWFPRRPRRCSWLRIRTPTAWLWHASLRSSSWPRVPRTSSSRRILPEQPAHANWPTWPAETSSHAGPRSRTRWQWKQARYTATRACSSASSAECSGQQQACRDVRHPSSSERDSVHCSSAAGRV